MGLFPVNADSTATNVSLDPLPSMTYYLDVDGGSIQGLVDGETAIRQAIHKALITNMALPLIYDGSYGSELESLIGSMHSMAYLQSEVPRMVKEALIYDDRIKSVSDVSVSISGDVIYVEFTVELTDKTKLAISEVVNS